MDAALLTTRLDFWALANERPTRIQLTTPIPMNIRIRFFLLTMICFLFSGFCRNRWLTRTHFYLDRDWWYFSCPHPYFEKKRDCPMNGMIMLNHHCSTYNPTDRRIVHVIFGRGPFNGLRKRGVMIGTCRIVQGWLLKSKYVLRLQSSIKAQWISCAAPKVWTNALFFNREYQFTKTRLELRYGSWWRSL